MKKQRVGKNQQRLLLLMWAGLALGLTRSPRAQYRIIKGLADEFGIIDTKNLRRQADGLYKAGLIKKGNHAHGVTRLELSSEGKRRARQYHLETLSITKPKKWDKKWRVILYDIPESKRTLRLELSQKLAMLGFVEVQQSVYAHPYECIDEITFLTETYDAEPYIRRMLVDHIDNEDVLWSTFRVREEARNNKNLKTRK